MDPEVVVAAWCGAGDRVPLEKIVADRGWQGTRAAQQSRVYCIADEFLNTPGSYACCGAGCAGLRDSSRTVSEYRKESGRLPLFAALAAKRAGWVKILLCPPPLVLKKFATKLTNSRTVFAQLRRILCRQLCKLLNERMLKYNWVGFYMLEPGINAADAWCWKHLWER